MAISMLYFGTSTADFSSIFGEMAISMLYFGTRTADFLGVSTVRVPKYAIGIFNLPNINEKSALRVPNFTISLLRVHFHADFVGSGQRNISCVSKIRQTPELHVRIGVLRVPFFAIGNLRVQNKAD